MNESIAMPRSDGWRADATRYNMLYRLVPCMIHKMAGTMQPVAMLAGMMARRLGQETLELPILSQTVTDMQLACKAAVTARTDVFGWLRPAGQKKITLADGVAQCTSLLAAEIAIGGSTIDNQTVLLQTQVEQASVRSVLTATLFAVLDHAMGPVAVQLRGTLAAGYGTCLTVSWTPLKNSDAGGQGMPSHLVDWDGVQAISDQEKVELRRTPYQVDIRFPAVE